MMMRARMECPRTASGSCHAGPYVVHVGWMDGWMDGYGWMDGWMGGWVDGWMDGWRGGTRWLVWCSGSGS